MSQNPLSIWHPFTQDAIDPAPIFVERAEGVYLYTRNGRRLLDAISSWWVTLHGHAHPLIAEAVAEQARKLEQVIFAGFTHGPAEELAVRLRKVLPPSLEHIFFSDDGSTAVEVALKMAMQFWWNQGKGDKRKFVALQHAYHGDTAGAMSVGEDSSFVAAFESLRFPVYRAPSAYCYRCPVGKTRATCDIECAQPLEQLLEDKNEEIAAVIVEPMLQAAGGMIVHPVEFLERIRRLTTRHNVLLIADEVLTGFGRTGRMFACDHANVVPDIMCLSKGITGGFLPLGATMCSSPVREVFRSNDRVRTFFHGHSYTGSPLACAAGIASLKIFESEPVFDRIAAIGRVHAERLPAFKSHSMVGDARAIGTIAAIEIVAEDAGYLSKLRPFLYNFFLDRGVLLRPLGNIVYILPPYAITQDELHFVYDVISEALDGLSNL